MNKKINTVLFILGATVFNILMMIVLMMLGLALVSGLGGNALGEQAASVALLIVFLGSIAGAFFIYHRLIKLISKRVNLDSYFHPIFGQRKK